jgi:nucleotide-binding universal stress UspA family protein
MSLQSIAVHMDETPGAMIRAEIAVELGAAHGATVEPFIVSTTPAVPYGPGALALAGALQSMRNDIAMRHREEADKVCRAVEAAHKLKTTVLDTTADRVVVEVASRLRPVDLAVLAPPRSNGVFGDEDVFEAAVFAAGRPALVIPPSRGATPVGRSVAIAWKDSREAARAIHDAMPLLLKADSVRFVVVHSAHDDRFFGQPALDRMQANLKGRGVKLGEPVIEATKADQSEAIHKVVRSIGADVMVMGAYGRWRFSEILFGGFTQYALEHGDVALFASH